MIGIRPAGRGLRYMWNYRYIWISLRILGIGVVYAHWRNRGARKLALWWRGTMLLSLENKKAKSKSLRLSAAESRLPQKKTQ